MPTTPPMRLRIVHQLSLLLAGIVLVSLVAAGALLAWNLRAGFSDYQRSRDAQQLDRFARVVAEQVDWTGIDPPRLPMRELMDEFLRREGLPPRERPPPPAPGEGRPQRPPPPGPDGLGRRLQVLDAQGQHLAGPSLPPQPAPLERAVQVGGLTVGWVRMQPSVQLADVDARFLQRQYAGLAAVLGATLVLALLAAYGVARRLAAPLQALRAATGRIAAGELAVALPPSGSREMAELIADVNAMAAALHRLEGARRRWIAQISHELRTPLSVLLGELEAVQDGARSATPELVATLRDEVLQLVRLVDDLHTLSMADLGALPCSFHDADAAAVLRRQAERFTGRLAAHGLALSCDNGGALPVHWDTGRIEQLVANLLENSLRYTDAPGQVRLGWRRRGSEALLWVEDSAPGVSPAQCDAIFEPLMRLDAARQRQVQPGRTGSPAGSGSGLGLAICKAIVQAHGGRIAAAPCALGGLRVEAVLPLEGPQA